MCRAGFVSGCSSVNKKAEDYEDYLALVIQRNVVIGVSSLSRTLFVPFVIIIL